MYLSEYVKFISKLINNTLASVIRRFDVVPNKESLTFQLRSGCNYTVIFLSRFDKK